ncbi:transmembrane protein [Rhynchospora pubera]|uniref:Transmembrane protein n=1 Tax=Rhynchospora pubera TaxID=906938 RepID=A0AAV8EZW5_9POAL|nr:transmembrane protein [Rhynchospora pubera]KAJ4786299.1 transmembrane protein [Rhynchospora pubera]KAJ4804813.1 transmembrane protein [Rhynchospora pubera]
MGQVMNKLKKGDPTPQQVEKLAEDIKPIIDKVYEAELKDKKDVKYDDLYHAIFLIIQELRKKSGAMQYELPPKQELSDLFSKYHRTGTLTKEECRDIINRVIKLENFSVGQGAIDILMYLFGIPICALMAKRVIPGMKSISDDVVVPLATSGSVIFLVKTHKL